VVAVVAVALHVVEPLKATRILVPHMLVSHMLVSHILLVVEVAHTDSMRKLMSKASLEEASATSSATH
jgi:hypothetical protein